MKNLLDSFPNTLSPDYVPRNIARILPDPNSLSRSELLAWFDEKARLESLIIDNPLLFFAPNDGGQREFLTFDDPAVQGRYFFAGNKTGKTTGALINMLEYATGKALWGLPGRAAIKHRQPTRGAIFCEDFDTHREDILPRLFTWCPRNELAQTPIENGSTGNPARVYFKNGSIAYLRTYEQGYAKAEGKDYDWVLCNEPPPRDIYTAIWRGFTATHGIMWIAATLLSQTWLYDEMAQPFVRVFESSMYDNKWLSDEGRRNFMAMLDETELQVRIYGNPANLTGKVYSNFKDGAPFVIPTQDPPWDVVKDRPWPIVLVIDPHERKGLYCLWVYVTPTNELLAFDWKIIQPGPTTEVFAQLEAIETRHRARATLCIMDPNRGKAIQKDYSCWGDDFEAHDFSILWPDDAVDYGLSMVRDYLHGIKPRLRFFDCCLGQGGPIWQMQRYVWDEWKRGSYGEKAAKEKPKPVNSDFPDCIRYLCVSKLDYGLLRGDNLGILRINGGEEQNGVRYRGNPYAPKRGQVASHARDSQSDGFINRR